MVMYKGLYGVCLLNLFASLGDLGTSSQYSCRPCGIQPVHQLTEEVRSYGLSFRPIPSSRILLSVAERSMRVEGMSEIQASP